MAEEPKKQKDLFFTEKFARIYNELRTYMKADRLQYRIDAKALMCRGIEDKEVKTIQNGLYVEDGMFYMSRLYVPVSLFSMYRSGIFQESFSFMEFKYIFRILVVMQLIDLAGHAAMRYITRPIVNKYVSENELAFAFKKKKIMDDYLIQKNYFKSKKEAKEAPNGQQQ